MCADFHDGPEHQLQIRGLIHWCETTDSNLTIFPCNARRLHTLGSSAFRLSTTAVSMSLTGSCFSPESAPGPFHHGIRERGGPIFRAASPFDERRSKRTYDLASSIVPRGTSCHRAVEFVFSPIGFDLALSCGRSLLLGPAELGAVNPDAVHDHSQPARQRHDRLFYAAAPGDLHRPGLEPRPFR